MTDSKPNNGTMMASRLARRSRSNRLSNSPSLTRAKRCVVSCASSASSGMDMLTARSFIMLFLGGILIDLLRIGMIAFGAFLRAEGDGLAQRGHDLIRLNGLDQILIGSGGQSRKAVAVRHQ